MLEAKTNFTLFLFIVFFGYSCVIFIMVQVNEVDAERSWFGEMKMKSGLCCERAFNVMPWILNYSCENLYKTIL